MRLDFDRGTIVCSEPDPKCDPFRLPGVLWDERVAAFRAPAYRYGEIAAALRASGTRTADAVMTPWEAAEYADTRSSLRPYQQAAVGAWDVMGRRGMVVLPTGAGKTHVAYAAIQQVRRPTLCLVPTRILLRQWVAGLRAALGSSVGIYGERDLRAITVATFESAYRQMAELGNRFELLVIDEGLDVPDADVAVIVGGTHGEREHVQRIGRLLRPRPGKKAVVYELVTRATPEVRNGIERRRPLAARTAAHLSAA